jgi:VWFA-related protein
MHRWPRCYPLLLCIPAIALAQQTSAPPSSGAQPVSASGQKDPVLALRPPLTTETTDGRIQLDVVVTGKQGGAVSGLELNDFTLLDNKQAQKILGFHAEGGTAQTRATPSEVILVLDNVNETFEQAAFERIQMKKFLTQNGGRLAYRTSIAVFSMAGLRIQPKPSSDGNALADMLDQASASAQLAGPAAGSYGEIGRFQLSVRALAAIAENEAKRPGVKMLIWVGPGWPLLAGSNFASSSKDRQRLFDVIVELSTRLREAHVALCSVAPINIAKGGAMQAPPSAAATTASMASAEAPLAHREVESNSGATDESNYKSFLKGVRSARQADSANLALQVIAEQSGGRVQNPSNDLVGQIADCLADLSAFYSISFNPSHAEHADDYHELKVIVNKAGLTARTNTGYYNRPL